MRLFRRLRSAADTGQDLVSLALAAALLLGVLLAVSSCGTDDLVFPGAVPNTPTSQFTATPTEIP